MSCESNNNGLFNNVGKKLQRIARNLFFAAVIISILLAIASIVAIIVGFITTMMVTAAGFAGLVFAALFLLFSYIHSLVLFGFGEIVSSAESSGDNDRRSGCR